MNIVGILHEHEVAADGQNFRDDRHITVEGSGGQCDVAVFRVAGGIQIVHHAGATNINGATDSGVRLDGLGNGGSNRSRDLTVVGFVASNVGHGDCYRNTQPLAVSGVAGGTVASNQFLTIEDHLHEHFVASLQRRRQRSAVDLGGRGEELNLDDLVRSSYANHAQVAGNCVLEELIDAVVAQERDAAFGNGRGPDTNQFFIVIQRGNRNRGVEGKASYGNVFLSLDQHVNGAEVCDSAKSNLTRLLVDENSRGSRRYSGCPEGKSGHVIIVMSPPFSTLLRARAESSVVPEGAKSTLVILPCKMDPPLLTVGR